MDDVIIIGGGFSGLSAALQLARAGRRTTVLDTGMPRNRFAAAAHGVLGHDGKPPREILREARAQIAAYVTNTFVDRRALSARRNGDGFEVWLEGGDRLGAKYLILAYGLRDEVPDLEGAAECWGISLVHCPYCHGHEFRGKRLAGMLRPGHVIEGGTLYRDWSDHFTIFSNGEELPPGTADALVAKDIRLNTDRVTKLEHRDGHLTAIVTERETIPMDALFGPAPMAFTSPIGEELGCKVDRSGLGPFLVVDEGQQTSVPGVFAAGDISRPMHSIPLAMTSGSGAAVFAHRALLGL